MLNTLQPQEVFALFNQILQIPRPSKHEEQISQWLVDFAAQHNIACERDQAMNVIMRVPATPGYEEHPGVILQAHMDMVCEKNSDVQHDFLNDPIQAYVDGDYLKAKGTTLGGDDGIGVAMALAALISPTLKHPALECLFTVDEETGLTGAMRLQDGCLNGKKLINLDSEDDAQVFIGCAGGIDTLAKMHYQSVECPKGTFAAKIRVAGLQGGHSGDDINKRRGNSNKIMVRFLFELLQKTDLNIAYINGGNLRNAIARETEVVVCVPMADKELLRVELNHYIATIEEEIIADEPNFFMEMQSVDTPETIIPHLSMQKLIRALYACPHGVVEMSVDMPGLVETSTNLASIKMKENEEGHYVEINTSQRSSVESKKHDIKNQVECALALACDEVTHGDGYPGWKPNVHSPLLEVAKTAFEQLFEQQPRVLAIHAGLECGLFLKKYPYLDMISIGPQMYGVHSPQERLSISSTLRCWQWLCKILESL